MNITKARSIIIGLKRKRLLSMMVVIFLLITSIAPAYNVLEMKAFMLSVSVFTQSPGMANYYDLEEFTQNIVNGFYIAQCIAKGVTPKASKRSQSRKDPRSNDWAVSSGSTLRNEKNVNAGTVQAQVHQTNFLHNIMVTNYLGAVFKRDTGPGESSGVEILLLSLIFLVLARGSLDPSILGSKNNIAYKNTQLGVQKLGFLFMQWRRTC